MGWMRWERTVAWGCSRVHEVTPIRAGTGSLEGTLVFLVPITPQTPTSNGPPSRCGLPCRATSRESKGSSFIAVGC